MNTKVALLCLMIGISVFWGCESGNVRTNGTANPNPAKTTSTVEQLITKSWRLNKLDILNEAPNPAIMGTSSFTFYGNGRYEILMGELERGKWSLSPDKKILITKADDRPQSGEMDIIKVTDNLLILTNNIGAKPMTLELVPVN